MKKSLLLKKTEKQLIVFEFFWVQLPHGVPDLIADHGQMLPQLVKSLRASPPNGPIQLPRDRQNVWQ